ncbi:hypothetical protein V6N12_018383 [Hibiscus sabdariffa]|uniref:Uncharacterized protein n=1 Tax=Hibiscus sabdariffa TaxID=183260 RepID=A0ABR2BQ69_9ROSI
MQKVEFVVVGDLSIIITRFGAPEIQSSCNCSSSICIESLASLGGPSRRAPLAPSRLVLKHQDPASANGAGTRAPSALADLCSKTTGNS